MTLKYFSLLVFSVTLLFNLTSCDSSSPEEGLNLEERDALTAESLSRVSVLDSIFFVTSNNIVPIVGTLTFNSYLGSVVGTQIYRYEKTGKYIFTITRNTPTDNERLFANSLDNTLTDNGTNAQLGARLRELLHREKAVFTNDELQEMSNILSPSGAATTITDSGVMVSLVSEVYTHLVTSSRKQQRTGLMAGTYYVDAESLEIKFRRPTTFEKEKYRFITSDDWIPYVSTTQRIDKRIQRGTWSYELHNTPFP